MFSDVRGSPDPPTGVPQIGLPQTGLPQTGLSRRRRPAPSWTMGPGLPSDAMAAWSEIDVHGEDYDEFAFLQGHAEWAGLPWDGPPAVERRAVDVGGGRRLSALLWGRGAPELVLVHGAGQNAHTWDTFAMATNRPLVAVDLPGHGHSDWRDDRDYSPAANGEALASLFDQLAPDSEVVVGMSLGGLSSLRVAAGRPELVRRLVLVDITPGIGRRDADQPRPPVPTDLLAGPRTFESFQALLDVTAATMPHRSPESIIPGLRHNSKPLEDGQWGWRYDQLFDPARMTVDQPPPDMTPLWDDIRGLRIPTMLVRGGRSPVVTDEAVARFVEHRPDARVETVPDAGHAVQNDKPLELAALVSDFVG
jgi:pimeloyl-ACP methyl ester carboxylesterase